MCIRDRDGSKAAEAEEARGDGIVAEGEDEGAEAREIEEGDVYKRQALHRVS